MTSQQRRVQLRFRDYDYSNSGAYFITTCAHKRQCLFGLVIKDEMQLNDYGKIIAKCWGELPSHYPSIRLDYFIVMPNHAHGIIFLVEDGLIINQLPQIIGKNLNNCYSGNQGGETPPLRNVTLGNILGYFKYQTTKMINEMRPLSLIRVWQRGYYEHIIRNEDSLNRIREYIITNPQRWELDRENREAKGKDNFDGWLATFKTPPQKNLPASSIK